MMPGCGLALGANPYVPEAFIVVRRSRDTGDTVTLHVRRASGGGLAFQPGQFNMVSVIGVGEVPISISSAPDRPEVLAHTIRAVGPVTRRLVALQKGDRVGIRGPFGQGWPVEEARGRDVVIIAGGLGLAPLRPVILHVLAHRDAYRRVILLYGARTPADLLYARELERWRGRSAIDLRTTVDRADARWRGHVGVVPDLLRQVEQRFDPASAMALVCGPEIMMQFTVRELQRQGVPDQHIALSLERNMQCGMGLCGHCQYGPFFLCKDGPVVAYRRIAPFMAVREI